MVLFPFFLLATLSSSFIIPVPTNSERCMIIYSMNHEDTIKVTIKFPQDRQISEFYDYLTSIKDLQGNIIQTENVKNFIFKTEINVPNKTIYEACIRVAENNTRNSSSTLKYQGQVNIDYEANTHFIIDEFKNPLEGEMLKDEQISILKKQASQVLQAANEYLKLQNNSQITSVSQFKERRTKDDTLFQWWMLELFVILSIGCYQWLKMKNRLQPTGNAVV